MSVVTPIPPTPADRRYADLGQGRTRRAFWQLQPRHESMLTGRIVALVVIALTASFTPIEATTREHLLAVGACLVALALHLGLVLLPRRRDRLLLSAVDASLVVDAALIFVLAQLSGGVDGVGLWLLPLVALAVTLGYAELTGVKVLILGGIVLAGLYSVGDADAPGPDETSTPLIVAAAAVAIASAFNHVNERELHRRKELVEGKWEASGRLPTATAPGDVIAIVEPAFVRLLDGWTVAVALGGGEDGHRLRTEGRQAILDVPLVSPEDGRVLGSLSATRPTGRFRRETLSRDQSTAVFDVADAAAAALARIEQLGRLERLSLADALTGLGNRRAFDEAIAAEMSRAARSEEPVGLVMLDVDHFKRFNDRHGHQAGDEALVAVAQAIGLAARAEDRACRVGGEEFALILPGADVAAAAIVAERVRLAIAAHPAPVEPVTVSLGVAAVHGGGVVSDLVSAADTRLYAAKEAGRNRVVAG